MIYREERNLLEYIYIYKEFFKVQKIAFFQKRLTHAFDQKMPISSLFKFD